MKSLDELYKECQNNEELKKAFISAFKEGRTEEFLKANDCDATAADVMTFLSRSKEEAATEDDLAKVAGGCGTSATCGNNCSYNCYYTEFANGLGYCH